MKKILHKDWKKKGVELFGEDMKTWIFVCPKCKTKQTINDFVEKTDVPLEDIPGYIAFSCIGRFNEYIGCDWTLGGLLQIHELEIELDDGIRRAFEFYEED